MLRSNVTYVADVDSGQWRAGLVLLGFPWGIFQMLTFSVHIFLVRLHGLLLDLYSTICWLFTLNQHVCYLSCVCKHTGSGWHCDLSVISCSFVPVPRSMLTELAGYLHLVKPRTAVFMTAVYFIITAFWDRLFFMCTVYWADNNVTYCLAGH